MKETLNFSKRQIVKTTIILMVITAILCFVAGCGPGRPFEIESLDTLQPNTAALVAAAR